MADRGERLILRLLLTGGIAGSAAIIALYSWASHLPEGTERPSPSEKQVIRVEPRLLSSRLQVMGKIEPAVTLTVTAPFDGVIKEKWFEIGKIVDRGHPLFTMDLSEMDSRIREAQSTFLRLSREARELTRWESSAEVMRARRTVTAAEMRLHDTEAKLRQTEMLFKRGIVPRMEFEALEQQSRQQSLDLAAANKDLEYVLSKGDPENRKISELELENARGKLADLQAQRAQARVTAPETGLVLRPPAGPGSQPLALASWEAGSRLSRGQAVIMIGALDRLAVSARIDEVDINQVKEGQGVDVTGDGFGSVSLRGRVTSVASQTAGEVSRIPAFEIKVNLDVSPELLHQIRVGMSARVSIVVREKPLAVVVPVQAIRTDSSGQASVLVRDPQGLIASRMVVVGESIDTGIEILSGLSVGDEIVLP